MAEDENPSEGKTMTDEDLAVIIGQQEAASYAFTQSQLATDRAKALDYYLGKKFGNEVDGRSQVISTDVFDTVEGMLPFLVEAFTTSNKIGECEPFGIEDEQEAKQQTDAANYVLFKQNPATLIFYTWFKDALLSKVGVVKYYYDDQKNEFRIERYANLTQQELIKLASQDHVEILRGTQHDLLIGMQPMPVYDVEVKVYTKRGRIKVCNVPPEHFYVSPRQNSLILEDCEFCCHKEQKTITDLIEMGFEKDELENIGDGGDLAQLSQEAQARNLYATQDMTEISDADRSMRQIWCSDCYIQIDYDGDGVAELRHVFMAGNKVLSNETTDHIPFAVISPILFPHQFYGLSAADITMDVQFYKSAIHRQMMDSLYLSNNPRNAVLEGQVDMDDLLTSRPGGIVRMRVPGAVTPLTVPFVGKESFPMLEYWESVKENRTGVTRYNQGMDADSLNKTAHGISQIMTAAMKRQQLMARLFAETGVKQLFQGVLHCLATSGMKSLIVRLTNGYAHIDPRQWKNQYDVTINVALGSGLKEREIQMLGMLSAKQLELKQSGRGYMVSEENDYNMAQKLSEATGHRNAGLFFTDPKAVPPQAKIPPPNLDMIKLQTDAKLKIADMQQTTQQKDKDMMNDRMIEEMKAKVSAETDIQVALINKQAQEAVARIRAETETRLKAADVINDSESRQQDAQLKVWDTVQKTESQAASTQASAAADQSNQQMMKTMQFFAQHLQDMAIQMQSMAQKKVKRTIAKKDKSGKLISTTKVFEDDSTEEIPHQTVQ